MVILADEPTGNLDSASSAQALSIFRELVDETGRAILMSPTISIWPPKPTAKSELLTVLTFREDGSWHKTEFVGKWQEACINR